MTKQQAEIILAFAQNDMKVKETGEQLYMCGANVSYHLNRIHKKLGWNPRKFFDLCYLVGVAARMTGGNNEQNRV